MVVPFAIKVAVKTGEELRFLKPHDKADRQRRRSRQESELKRR